MTVEIRILGPFEVRDPSGGEVRLPGGRERALLAVLLLRRGEVVSMDALVDALWGADAPSTAAKAVQGYVSHLRRALELAAGSTDVLVTQPPGYVLRVQDESVDSRRFEKLAAEAWRMLQDDPRGGLATFDEALALWRGPVLDEFAFADFAQTEIRRLDELRLETLEGRFEAMLQLGRHGALVAELETRVAEHPLRERLRGQLMLALYRSGRQAEALEAYRNGRRLLSEELGLEPGTELQRLERAILAQDPALEPPEPRPRRRASEPAVPHRSAAAPRRGRARRLAMGSALLAVAAVAATLGYVLVTRDSPASVAVTPPALVVVDPSTNRVVASIRVGSNPAAVAAGAGRIWVGDTRDGTVTQVNPETRTVVRTIGVGAPVVDLATGLGSVWAATGGFGEIVRIDPEVGGVSQRIALGDPEDPVVPSVASVGVGDGRVWAGALDGLARIDPASGDVVATIDLGGTDALQVAVGNGAVWATTFGNRAKRVEASSSRVTAEFYSGGWVYPIALGGGNAWVGGQSGLSKMDPDTAAALASAASIREVSGVAYGERTVWITSFDAPEVVRVDADTGAIEARVPIGGYGEDVAVHAGLVWVVVQPSE